MNRISWQLMVTTIEFLFLMMILGGTASRSPLLYASSSAAGDRLTAATATWDTSQEPSRGMASLWDMREEPFPWMQLGPDGEQAMQVSAQQAESYRYFLFSIGAQAAVGQFNFPTDLSSAPDGSVYVVDSQNCRIQHFAATGVFINAWGSCGTGEGQFFYPEGIAVAPDGTIYVADSGNHRIQHFSPTGTFLNRWGSYGSGDGQFNWPEGIAVASDGTVYVADTRNHRIQRFSAIGAFLGKWGSYGSGDGQFDFPSGIAVSPDGTVYVADYNNNRIQRFTPTGIFIMKWGSQGSGNGQLDHPRKVAVASDGKVYIADTWNRRIQYFSANGTFLGWWGSFGSGDGQFSTPYGVTIAPDGKVYVVDYDLQRVQYFSTVGTFLGKWGSYGSGDGQFDCLSSVAVAPDGTIYVTESHYTYRIQRFSVTGAFLGKWGSYGSGDGQFYNPSGIAVAPGGAVYVADTYNHRIQRFSAAGAFLGKWGFQGSGDGQFNYPYGVAIAPDGTVYVADTGNNRIQRFSATGTFLGKWGFQGSGDGQFNNPRGVAVAPDGTVYVADTGNNRIQRFSANGAFLSKWGSYGSGDGQFRSPSGVAVAPDRTVYVADTGNNRIQRFSAAGAFLGKWGSYGSGDGQFDWPYGVAVAPDGTIYVADTWNHRIQAFGTAYPATWRGEFFGNDWLAERPLLVTNTSSLNFEWAASPASGLPTDHFSDRWLRYVYFDSIPYEFTLTADDGVRFWIDDRLYLDGWYQHQRNTYTLTVSLAEGYHRLLIEHREDEGPASLAFSFTPLRPWTFMLYLDGDNNLYPYLDRAIRNLEAQPTNPNVNILVLFDGDRNNDSWRFLLQPGGNYTIGVNKWYMGELNMGNPDTLRDFITWARENYPAQHYYLAIADHGRGTSGIAWDDTSNKDNLTPAELRSALQQATNSGQWKIDVLHYDACLMALLENVYQVKDYADFLVASQNLGWAVFAYEAYARFPSAQAQALEGPYEFAIVVSRVTASTTPRQLAIQIADAYFNHPAIQSYPRTISALDLSRAVSVRQAVDGLSTALRNNLSAIKTYVQNARSATQKFDSRDYYKITDDDEYLDLYHLAQRLKQYVSNSEVQGAAQGVMEAINAGFVVVEHHQSGMWGGEEELYWDLDNAHGVSIYFPPRSGSSDYNKYISHQLFRFTADGQWDDFLVDYFGVMGLPPESPTEPELPPMLALQSKVYLPLLLRNR